jgi:tetratricopeptide (TPR) repeat protein
VWPRRIAGARVSAFLVPALALVTGSASAQVATPGGILNGVSGGLPGTGSGLTTIVATASLDIYLKTPDGAKMHGAVITLLNLSGQTYKQLNAETDYVRFNDLPVTEYTVRVTAPGYQPALKKLAGLGNAATLVIDMQPASAEDAAFASRLATLPPKTQKEMGKAIAALHASDLPKARGHLDNLQRLAPDHAEVNYLLGVYAVKQGDEEHAKSYWTRALEIDPRHLRALFSLSEIDLHEKKYDEALALGKRAVSADPSSWQAHAVLATAYERNAALQEAIEQAERALELGHSQAVVMQPFLAGLLARTGERGRALALLQPYVKEHPADGAAQKELASIEKDEVFPVAGAAVGDSAVTSALTALPPATNWLPPDVDEKMPPVENVGEAGTSCDVGAVVAGVGRRIQELVGNVDRYTATESLYHESINKWGTPSSTETRKFNYLASIEEMRPGFFNVEEYRSVPGASAEFPDGVATLGLPSMALLFHPHNAGSFDMVCEGLTHWDGIPVWQIHFRQRPDKPNTMRRYREGAEGPSRPVAMKGRAWIAADTYQLVRLETDLVSAVPEIQLYADHTIIEYGPVHFQSSETQLWLPTSAEVFFHWKNHRMHRRHSFDKFLLFAVDDKQKISAPRDPAIQNATPPNDTSPSTVPPNVAPGAADARSSTQTPPRD